MDQQQSSQSYEQIFYAEELRLTVQEVQGKKIQFWILDPNKKENYFGFLTQEEIDEQSLNKGSVDIAFLQIKQYGDEQEKFKDKIQFSKVGSNYEILIHLTANVDKKIKQYKLRVNLQKKEDQAPKELEISQCKQTIQENQLNPLLHKVDSKLTQQLKTMQVQIDQFRDSVLYDESQRLKKEILTHVNNVMYSELEVKLKRDLWADIIFQVEDQIEKKLNAKKQEGQQAQQIQQKQEKAPFFQQQPRIFNNFSQKQFGTAPDFFQKKFFEEASQKQLNEMNDKFDKLRQELKTNQQEIEIKLKDLFNPMFYNLEKDYDRIKSKCEELDGQFKQLLQQQENKNQQLKQNNEEILLQAFPFGDQKKIDSQILQFESINQNQQVVKNINDKMKNLQKENDQLDVKISKLKKTTNEEIMELRHQLDLNQPIIQNLQQQFQKPQPTFIQLNQFNLKQQNNYNYNLYLTPLYDNSLTELQFVIGDENVNYSIGILGEGNLDNLENRVRAFFFDFPECKLTRGSDESISFSPRQILRKDRFGIRVDRNLCRLIVSLNGQDLPPINLEEGFGPFSFVLKSQQPIIALSILNEYY